MPWKHFFTLLIAVLGAAALTVAVAAEVLPEARHDAARPLFMTGAMLLALAWRVFARRRD